MEVRPIRPGESEPAGQVVLAAYRALSGGHLTDDYAAQLCAVEQRTREAEVLVAVVPEPGAAAPATAAAVPSAGSGTIVGCVTLVPDASSPWAELLEEGEAGVRMLAVLPEAQGRGIGRALVDACVARARTLGRRALVLHTTPWMTAAQHVYETSGFERVFERDWMPVPEVPLLAYRLGLEGPRG